MSGKFMNSNKILIIILLLIFSNHLLALTTVTKNANGDWQLFLDGKPFFVKGVNYDTTKICSMQDWKYLDSNNNGVLDGPYEAWVDENKNNNRESSEVTVGDFKLMQNMGANVIRHYLDGRSSDYANWKNLFRDLYYNYGIMVIMGNFLGAYGVGVGETPVDYTNPTHRARMLQSVTNVVLAYKDEPYILCWILGNENNYSFTSTLAYKQPAQYAQFLNLVAQKIKQLDPTRPVAMCNGDTQFLSYYNQYAQSIDIFGLNCFRGSGGFGNLFTDVKNGYGKPVLLTEYGGPWEEAWQNGQLKPSFEIDQLTWHSNCWKQIMANSYKGNVNYNAIGGTVVHWLDRWWEHGGACTQDPGDNGGICSQGDGNNSPFLRQLRLVYYYYQNVWTNNIPGGNIPPNVTITSPANNSVYNEPATIVIQATATDADGNISKVEFYNGATKLGEDNTPPYSYNWNNVTAGQYTLIAKAYDNQNSSRYSTPVNILVLPKLVIPGKIECENYKIGGEGIGYHDTTPGNSGGSYRNDDVDIQVSTNIERGYNIGWISAGEWLAYDVEVLYSDNYQFLCRVASAVSGTKTFHIEFNGTNVTGPINFTFSDGWQKWHTVVVSNVYLQKGNYTMKIVMDTGNFNLNYIDIQNNNLAPIINIISPTNNSIFNEGERITIVVSATDKDGYITKVELYANGIKIGTDTTKPYEFNITLNSGEYEIIAKAYDNENAFKTSSIIKIKILSSYGTVIPSPNDLNYNEFIVFPSALNFYENDKLYIRYKSNSPVEFLIYNISGTKINVIQGTEGANEINWDGKNTYGRPVAPGVYFIFIKSGNEIINKKSPHKVVITKNK
jgi:beta-glucuronidase